MSRPQLHVSPLLFVKGRCGCQNLRKVTGKRLWNLEEHMVTVMAMSDFLVEESWQLSQNPWPSVIPTLLKLREGFGWASSPPSPLTMWLFACSCPIGSTLANDILLNVRAVHLRLLPLSEHLHTEQKPKTLRSFLLPAVAVCLARVILPPYMSFRPWHTTRVASLPILSLLGCQQEIPCIFPVH